MKFSALNVILIGLNFSPLRSRNHLYGGIKLRYYFKCALSAAQMTAVLQDQLSPVARVNELTKIMVSNVYFVRSGPSCTCCCCAFPFALAGLSRYC